MNLKKDDQLKDRILDNKVDYEDLVDEVEPDDQYSTVSEDSDDDDLFELSQIFKPDEEMK